MQHRTSVIVGATSGIAEALAARLALEGDRLVLAGRDMPRVQALAQPLRDRHGATVFLQRFDALELADHAGFLQRCVEAAGRIDRLIVCYGVIEPQPDAQRDFQVAARMIDVNYRSCVSLLERAAEHFEQRGGGGVICVLCSVAGDRGRRSNYIYGSTKAALTVYLQGLRARLHPAKVRVVTVKPGPVDTRMIRGRFDADAAWVAKPSRVARQIARSLERGPEVLYTPRWWRPIMLLVRAIPERLAKRLRW